MTRFGYVMMTYFSGLGIAVASLVTVPVKLLWNATASTPLGLYRLGAADHLKRGDLVAIMPDMGLADFMVARGYIGRGVPLLKHIAALSGDSVCRRDNHVTVNGRVTAEALPRDHLGRPLPVWRGCRRLSEGEIFLLNSGVRDSLDGRYFGALKVSAILGKATPLYTDPGANGHFVWRATSR
jgi:conjugative transfer signal peptidase TraF